MEKWYEVVIVKQTGRRSPSSSNRASSSSIQQSSEAAKTPSRMDACTMPASVIRMKVVLSEKEGIV